MASPLRLTVVALGGSDVGWAGPAESVWLAIRAEFEAAEQAMSRFRPDSEMTRLNALAATGSSMRVGRRLERALVASDRARRITDGRFDPRVLTDLVRLGDAGAPVPTRALADRDRARPLLERSAGGAVCVDHPIDLGGIGKGLALRWAGAIAAEAGLTGFLLDAGGDLVGGGTGPDGGPWAIGIEDPAGGSDPLAVIALTDGAVATSSIRRRHWVHEGRAVHHLLDPRTGEPADGGLAAVTVAGPDPAWAEVWSKTLFIGGLATIADEARARGLAAWWVSTTGELAMTAGARARTTWVASEA